MTTKKNETERLEQMLLELMVSKKDERGKIVDELKEREAAVVVAKERMEDFDKDVATLAGTISRVQGAKAKGKTTPFRKPEEVQELAKPEEPKKSEELKPFRFGHVSLYEEAAKACYKHLKAIGPATSGAFREIVLIYHPTAKLAYVKALASWYMSVLRERGMAVATEKKHTYEAVMARYARDKAGNPAKPPMPASERVTRQKRA